MYLLGLEILVNNSTRSPLKTMTTPRVIEISSFRVKYVSKGEYRVYLRFADGENHGKLVLNTSEPSKQVIPKQILGFWEQTSENTSKSGPPHFVCIDPKYKNLVHYAGAEDD